MFIKIGLESQRLKGRDENSNVWKDRITKPMCIIKGHNPSVWKEKFQNSNVYKNRAESQCLQWKDKIRIPVFSKIDPESQCFEGLDQKTSVYN